MLIGLLAALVSAFLIGIVAVIQAVAVRRLGPSPGLRQLVRSRLLWVVVATYALGWVLHLVAIAQLPLYLAQSGIVLGLAVTAIAASVYLRERLNTLHWFAVALTVVSLFGLAAASGKAGDDPLPTSMQLVLYAGLPVLVGTGWLASRRLRGHPAAAVLGVLGGLGYTGTPLCTRMLVDPALDLTTVLAFVVLCGYGVTAFWLYSVALQRAPITISTGPLVVVETVVPAALGVAFLGDQLRSGWEPLAALALTLALVGGWLLSDVEIT